MNPKKVIIIAIIIIVCIVGFFVLKTNMKTNVSIEKLQQIPYEYFVLYAKNDKTGVVDKTGKILIEPKYTNIYIPNPSKDVFICSNEDESKILNKSGEEIYKDYEEVTYLETSEATELVLESQVLKYKNDGLYGVLSIDGEVLTEPIYEAVTSLPNKPGALLVKKEGLYGGININ